VCEPLVARLAPARAAAGRLERGRLSVEAANGVAGGRPGGPLAAAGLPALRPPVPAPGRPLSRSAPRTASWGPGQPMTRPSGDSPPVLGPPGGPEGALVGDAGLAPSRQPVRPPPAWPAPSPRPGRAAPGRPPRGGGVRGEEASEGRLPGGEGAGPGQLPDLAVAEAQHPPRLGGGEQLVGSGGGLGDRHGATPPRIKMARPKASRCGRNLHPQYEGAAPCAFSPPRSVLTRPATAALPNSRARAAAGDQIGWRQRLQRCTYQVPVRT
jgi:hypothetical protein